LAPRRQKSRAIISIEHDVAIQKLEGACNSLFISRTTIVMGKNYWVLLALLGAAGLCHQVGAQAPPRQTANKPASDSSKDKSTSTIVTQMLAFDKNGDGKLTKDEVTDERLHRLFDRADANKDGVVTKEELIALAAVMEAEMGQGGGRGGPGGDFGGPPDGGRRGPGEPPDGGRGRRGPGGPGDGGPGMRGPGGFGGPPQPGQIMPIFLQDRLGLTADQKSRLQDLQKEVDGKMAKILTSEQKSQLKEMQDDFGPPGRGGRGRGGPGGRGGPPPGGGPGGPGGGGPGGGGLPGGPGGPPDR
jgi:hypothetical protein